MTFDPATQPVLQISRSRVTTDLPPAVLAALRDRWTRTHSVFLPRFLHPSLLEFVQARVRVTPFQPFVHDVSGHELKMDDNDAVWQLDFLMNAPEVLRALDAIISGHIGAFFGRIYQLAPGSDMGHRWHRDLGDGRMLAVTVNLSEGRYEGGLFEWRHRHTHEPYGSLANLGPGDALMVRLGEDIEHRVVPVTGTVPRVAYAGWMLAGESYDQRVKRGSGRRSTSRQ